MAHTGLRLKYSKKLAGRRTVLERRAKKRGKS